MFTWCCSKLCLNEPSYMHVAIPALLRCVWFSCLCLEPIAWWTQRMIHLILLHVTSVHVCCPSYRESTYIWFIGRTRFYSYFLRERKGFKWAHGSRELSAHQVNKAAPASTPQQEAESEQEVRRLCVLQQPFPRDICPSYTSPNSTPHNWGQVFKYLRCGIHFSFGLQFPKPKIQLISYLFPEVFLLFLKVQTYWRSTNSATCLKNYLHSHQLWKNLFLDIEGIQLVTSLQSAG